MRTINLVAENDYEKLVKEYLEENASEELANKINSGTKTLYGAFKYMRGEAEKLKVNNVAVVRDEVVFGWAVHYFEEDSIAEDDFKSKTPPKKEKKVKETKPEPKEEGRKQLDMFGEFLNA